MTNEEKEYTVVCPVCKKFRTIKAIFLSTGHSVEINGKNYPATACPEHIGWNNPQKFRQRKKKRFVVLAMSSGNYHRVHREGCKDIEKDRRNSNGDWVAEGKDVDEAVKEEIQDYNEQGQDFTINDFDILPCCRKNKNKFDKICEAEEKNKNPNERKNCCEKLISDGVISKDAWDNGEFDGYCSGCSGCDEEHIREIKDKNRDKI